ncbi:MAG: putative oxidoreductase [Acidimicrobiales bacterium]|jgi:putative oxidoreductase
MHKHIQKCETYLEPAGRIVIGTFFMLAGIVKFQDIAGTAGYIDSVGLPAASILAVAVAAFEVLAGLALIIGKYTKYAALLLAGFTLVASIIFHGPDTWTEAPMQQMMFMKNIAIIGGLLFMSAHLTRGCHAKKTTGE